MIIEEAYISGIKIINPKVYNDSRGYFYEIFQKNRYEDILGVKIHFLQDNISYSKKNVLRGLHFQKQNPQGKLIYVSFGEIFDVVVDIRKNSPTFGKNFSVLLNDNNNKQLWIPPGFAHGFLVLSDVAIFNYKCDNYYNSNDEFCIKWNDVDLAIEWPCKNPILSDKDAEGKTFKSII